MRIIKVTFITKFSLRKNLFSWVVIPRSTINNTEQHRAISYIRFNFYPLPRNFYLNLDNYGGENKIRYVFSFLSLLTAKGIFEMVHFGFLMVGHTHEDINAMFSNFSKRLRTSQVHTFLDLMELFTLSSYLSPTPYLIEEVPNLKGFIDGYLCNGLEKLGGY